MSEERDILEWLASDDTGESSKTLAYRALGMRWRDESHPYDPADLNRCLLLLRAVPWVHRHIPAMSRVSPEWRRLVARWDEVVALLLDEAGLDWSKALEAPKTYRLMQLVYSGGRLP